MAMKVLTIEQIDRHGRVIDSRKNTSKLRIIEKEFELAERQERFKQREEMEMRVKRKLLLLLLVDGCNAAEGVKCCLRTCAYVNSIAFRRSGWTRSRKHGDRKFSLRCGRTGS